MPHPHEQKLHEVVNSLTSESFKSFVAARTAGTSRSPPSASPAPPPKVSLSRSLRLIADFGVASMALCPCGEKGVSTARAYPSPLRLRAVGKGARD